MSIVRRVRRDGTVGYQVRVSVAGRRLRAETFDTLREARRREAELVARRRRATTDETCDSFARRWADDFAVVKSGPTRGRRKSERTKATNQGRLKPFIAELSGVRLADLDRPTAVAFAHRHPRTAVVARGMFQDAVDAGLVDTNPFTRLNLEDSSGRRDHEPLTVEELHRLADVALAVHGPEYGPHLRAMILFTAYAGPRLEEGFALEWPWVDFSCSEVAFKVAKFDKPRTVLLLDEAATALRSMPRGTDGDRRVFRSKRGLPIRHRSTHYWAWSPVRAAFWAGLSEERRQAIVDLDWHSLRHFTGHTSTSRSGFPTS
jgi:integrase